MVILQPLMEIEQALTDRFACESEDALTWICYLSSLSLTLHLAKFIVKTYYYYYYPLLLSISFFFSILKERYCSKLMCLLLLLEYLLYFPLTPQDPLSTLSLCPKKSSINCINMFPCPQLLILFNQSSEWGDHIRDRRE